MTVAGYKTNPRTPHRPSAISQKVAGAGPAPGSAALRNHFPGTHQSLHPKNVSWLSKQTVAVDLRATVSTHMRNQNASTRPSQARRSRALPGEPPPRSRRSPSRSPRRPHRNHISRPATTVTDRRYKQATLPETSPPAKIFPALGNASSPALPPSSPLCEDVPHAHPR